MAWCIITRIGQSTEFYPVDILAQRLPAERFTYQAASTKPNNYWKGKNILFHVMWKRDDFMVWRKYYKKIAAVANTFWFEFDADNHVNFLHHYDFGKIAKKGPLYFWRGLRGVSNRFVWELPMSFNPFVKPVVRVPLRMYDRRWEKPVNTNKDIDFLGFIDRGNTNVAPTLRVLEELTKQGYSTRALFINKSLYRAYRGQLNFHVLVNQKFTPEAVTKWTGLLNRTKVLIDLSPRLTAGRIVYDSLFYGALAVCPDAYGASRFIFPDLVVNSHLLDMPDIYEKSIRAIDKWSPQKVEAYRDQAYVKARTGKFLNQLRRLCK